MLRTSSPTCCRLYALPYHYHLSKSLLLRPCAFNARIAFAVDSFGGSRNARYPISTISHSSFILNAPTGEGCFLCNSKHTNPLSFSSSTCFQNTPTNLFCKWLHSTITLRKRTDGKHFFYCSFVTICVFPFLSCTTVVKRRRVKSNGISSTFT